MDMHDRLKKLRIERGYKSAAEAARAMGIPAPTYSAHENGTTPPPRRMVEKYADFYRSTTDYILRGRAKSKSNVVRVSGRVGAGAQVHPVEDSVIDHIEVPFDLGADAEAVEVMGDSMWPAIQDGEVLIYERVRHDPTPLVGRKVVAKLSDGRMFVKLLGGKNKDGLWTLLSFNGPPMEDVDLEWAAEIRIIMRR